MQTPGVISITAATNGLAPSAQPYQGRIDVFDSANNVTSVNITLLVTGGSTPGANQTISHIAYGGGWQTSIVLVNLDSVPAQYTVNFWDDTGTLTTVPLGAGSASAGTISRVQPNHQETAALSTDPSGRDGRKSSTVSRSEELRLCEQKPQGCRFFVNTGSIKLLIPFDVGGPFALWMTANPSADRTLRSA